MFTGVKLSHQLFTTVEVTVPGDYWA